MQIHICSIKKKQKKQFTTEKQRFQRYGGANLFVVDLFNLHQGLRVKKITAIFQTIFFLYRVLTII